MRYVIDSESPQAQNEFAVSDSGDHIFEVQDVNNCAPSGSITSSLPVGPSKNQNIKYVNTC